MTLHIEVLQKEKSSLDSNNLKSLVSNWLSNEENLKLEEELSKEREIVYNLLPYSLSSHIEQITISKYFGPLFTNGVKSNNVEGGDEIKTEFQGNFHIYRLNEIRPKEEKIETDSEEDSPSALITFLPSRDFHGLWDNLIFDDDLKDQLLNFVTTSLAFADMKVNSKTITWNKVVLLHGPPGTGKTSLCKALAQKLSVRLMNRFQQSVFIEINCHSLFSKWFSESGKLVMKLFRKIQEHVEQNDNLVFVLIDEVESLAHNRKVGGNEPSDAIRVVNALLTQIDNIKNCPNVVILTTSNITEAIDLAFVDRADIKHYIGNPSLLAIYEIFRSCLSELVATKVVSADDIIFPLKELDEKMIEDFKNVPSYKLLKIVRKCDGFSGRILRKLPFLAIALFCEGSLPMELNAFLNCLEKAVMKQFSEKAQLNIATSSEVSVSEV